MAAANNSTQVSPPIAEKAPPFPVRRFTAEEYRRMVEDGLFSEVDYELVNGWLAPKNRHVFRQTTDGEIPALPVRRFTVAEYHRLMDIGVLAEGEKCELIEGWIVPMMSRNPQHDVVLELATDALRIVLPSGWRVRSHSAISGSQSEPEPDLAVVAGKPRDNLDAHPQAPNVALVVEVADSSLKRDRIEKAAAYARFGIAVYWVINLVDGKVEVYREPTPDGYALRDDYLRGDAVPLEVGGRALAPIAVNDLLP
jgi:Uma2 family endonuclease